MSVFLLTLTILLFSLYLGFKMLKESTKDEPGASINKIGGILLITLTGILFVGTIIFGSIKLATGPDFDKDFHKPLLEKTMLYKHSPHQKPPIFEPGFKEQFKEKLKDPEQREKLKERLKDKLEELNKNLEEIEKQESSEEKSPE
jgi:hypothetical protein